MVEAAGVTLVIAGAAAAQAEDKPPTEEDSASVA
jgi:DeoR family ulaG and ulaABCDEF operon transcriptional repressor